MKKFILIVIAVLVAYIAYNTANPEWNGTCYSQDGFNASSPRFDGRHFFEPKQSGCRYTPDSELRSFFDYIKRI